MLSTKTKKYGKATVLKAEPFNLSFYADVAQW